MTHTAQDHWPSLKVALVVTHPDPAEAVAGEGSPLEDVPHTSLDRTGQAWILAVDEDAFSADADAQLRHLTDQLQERRGDLDQLRAGGHALRIDVSGTVGTGDRLTLSPDSLHRVRRLALPLTFTTHANAEHHTSEDPLAWLEA